jgi:long-chain fatty acid transport protein
MRKILTFIAGTLITGSLLAGGVVTNTNTSASWVRLPARNASTEIDAVYYNPAGLMKLQNGFHISLSNQTIWQAREITNSYAGPGNAYGLNEHLYKGSVTAPFYPSIHAVYKLDKLAFSAGFMPVGGGGGATYEKGLPSFEMSPSDLVPSLAAAPNLATAYRLNVYFKGASLFFGYQGAISFKINDFISIAAGARYVTAKNTYEGYLKDIQVNIASGWTDATVIMTGIANQAKGGGDALAPYIATAGNYTADQLVAAGQMTVTTRNTIVNGLTSLGVQNAASLTLSQSQAAYYGAQAKYNATSTLLADQEADVTQSGSGITPFFSVNISPTENLNIAVKYEMATKLELENKIAKNLLIGYTAAGSPIYQFVADEKVRNDMPAMLTVGADLKLSNIKISLGGNYYFDKSADYGHKVDGDLNPQTPTTHIPNSDIIDNNGLTFQGGLEYNISDKFLVSGGYIWANLGVNALYQSDLTYYNSTQTFGAGGAYSVTDKIKINLGAGYTMYKEDKIKIDHIFTPTGTNIQADELFKKSTFMLGVGVDISF